MERNNLYEAMEYHKARPAIKVLLDTYFTKEIRILMEEEHEMKEHKTPFPIVIQIIEGTIDFGAKGQRYELGKGSIISLEGGVPHDLIARERSMVRLTLNKADQTSRVQNVANQ